MGHQAGARQLHISRQQADSQGQCTASPWEPLALSPLVELPYLFPHRVQLGAGSPVAQLNRQVA
jgi:hypothetical protein